MSTDLCQQQGLHPAPADIQRTVTLYQKQQHTDRQLVGILADLPAASTAQASADALLQRLQVQCTEQQLTVSPENLNRAVTLFQETPVPVTDEDAERLDTMVRLTREQQWEAQQAQDAQTWAAGLQQLRDSQGPT